MTSKQAQQNIADAVAAMVAAGNLDTAISILKIKLMELGETRLMVEALAPEIDRTKSGLQLRMF